MLGVCVASSAIWQTELQTEVHNLEATALALDAQLATSQALLDALSKETTHLQADLATWAAQRGSRGGAADAQAAAARSIERRDAATTRHAQVKDAVGTLGGISIVRMDDHVLELLLSTVVPPGPAAPSPTVRCSLNAVWEISLMSTQQRVRERWRWFGAGVRHGDAPGVTGADSGHAHGAHPGRRGGGAGGASG